VTVDFVLSRRAALVERLPRLVGILGFVTVTLVALAVFNDVMRRFYWDAGSWKIFVPFLAAAAVSLAFVRTRYIDFQPLLKASLRASAVGLLVFLVFDAPDFTLADPQAALGLSYVNGFYFPALTFAAAAVFRPAFIVPTAVYIMSTRNLVMAISGLEMSKLDIQYMIDMALYLSMVSLLVGKVGPRIHPWLASPDRQSEVVGVAIGLHLANYFWSGVAKMMIGATPWYWVFENKTFNRMPFMLEAGTLPYGHLPWATEFAWELMQHIATPMNAAILIAQCCAIICIFRMSWLKISVVLYDMLHIGIYVFGGTFFWPWIWNNATIWWAARTTKTPFSIHTTLACTLTILLGAPALNLNKAAWLGWFDIADSRQIHVKALTRDGREVEVPNAFFLAHSYSVGHGFMGRYPMAGQYEWGMIGNSWSVKRNEVSGTCPDPSTLIPPQSETPEQTKARRAELQRFFSAHHAKMLAREEAFGKGTYYLRLHHFPSNPFQYREFNALSLKDVVGYRSIVKSSCLDIKDGRSVTRKLWATNAEDYGV